MKKLDKDQKQIVSLLIMHLHYFSNSNDIGSPSVLSDFSSDVEEIFDNEAVKEQANEIFLNLTKGIKWKI